MGEYFAELVAGGPVLLALLAAAAAGLVSFASPCVVPLVPGYLSYLAGTVGAEAPAGGAAVRPAGRGGTRDGGAPPGSGPVVVAAVLFVAGFTVIFLLATVTVFGAISALSMGAETLSRVGGVVTIVMGLVFLGVVPGLNRDARPRPRRIASWIGAPLLGAVFALGWTPCLGPTLAAIISVAAGTEGTTALKGALLVVGYCAGLGLPFVLLALGSSRAVRSVDWLRRHSRAIQVAGGVVMIAVGVALLTGAWGVFVGWIRQWTVSVGSAPI